MSTPNYHLITLRERAHRLIVMAAGLLQASFGAALFVDGPDGFTLAAFPTLQLFPWWVWATSALASGLMILTRETEWFALCFATCWWALWSSLLIVGITRAGGPFSSCAVYVFMTALHTILAYLAFTERREGYR